jgi:hypothetical protein
MSEGAKREGPGDASEAEPELLDAQGRHRPRFVLGFPSEPELTELVALFEKGDFKTLSERAPELEARSADPRVRAACQELVRRTRPDPTVKILLAIALGFFAFVVVWTYW